jgi:hypothetical protein
MLLLVSGVSKLIFVVGSDKFSEDLDNPKMIKEILQDSLNLCLLQPRPMFEFLKQALAEVMSVELTQVNLDVLCWLIHSLRIFYSLLV